MYTNFFQPAPKPTPEFPTVVIPERVLTRMTQETLLFSRTETGEMVFGLELPGMLVVLGTIRDPEDVIREVGYFEHGGEDQYAVYKWIRKHWNAMRKESREAGQMTGWTPQTEIPAYHIPLELDADMHFIGDYHRHPGGYDQLSGKDRDTMFEILGNPRKARSQYLAPLITMKSHVQQRSFQDARLVVTTGSEIQIRFYYLVKGDERIFEVTPVIVPDSHLPWIPPVPWHLNDLNRMRSELGLLQEAGYEVQWGVQNIDHDPICEILFWIDHPDWTKKLVLVTHYDYPNTAAEAFIVDKNGEGDQHAVAPKRTNPPKLMAIVNRLLSIGKPRNTADDLFSWKGRPSTMRQANNYYLVDLIHDIEAQGGLREENNTLGQS